jgi:uncharacterized glyoxalase superfamily protein PhnB
MGFRVEWEHRFEADAPVYMQLARGDLVLHLSEHHGDCCPGACVYVRTTALDALHRELAAKDYRYQRPGIEPTPWGSRLLEVTDPFGNRLRFDEPAAPARSGPTGAPR